jgi:hypothetical protein
MSLLLRKEKLEVRSNPSTEFYLDSIPAAEKFNIFTVIQQLYEAAGCKVVFENVLDSDDLTQHRYHYISAPSIVEITTAVNAIIADPTISAAKIARDVYNVANNISFAENTVELDVNNYPQYV